MRSGDRIWRALRAHNKADEIRFDKIEKDFAEMKGRVNVLLILALGILTTNIANLVK